MAPRGQSKRLVWAQSTRIDSPPIIGIKKATLLSRLFCNVWRSRFEIKLKLANAVLIGDAISANQIEWLVSLQGSRLRRCY